MSLRYIQGQPDPHVYSAHEVSPRHLGQFMHKITDVHTLTFNKHTSILKTPPPKKKKQMHVCVPVCLALGEAFCALGRMPRLRPQSPPPLLLTLKKNYIFVSKVNISWLTQRSQPMCLCRIDPSLRCGRCRVQACAPFRWLSGSLEVRKRAVVPLRLLAGGRTLSEPCSPLQNCLHPPNKNRLMAQHSHIKSKGNVILSSPM